MKRLVMLVCLAMGVVASACAATSSARSASPATGAGSSASGGVGVTSMPVTATPATRSGSSAASSPTPTCSGFALSLISDRGGQSSPINAAVWFAQHGATPGIPDVGWKEVRTGEAEATVGSAGVQLHVIQGPDQTWQVDSGQYYCP